MRKTIVFLSLLVIFSTNIGQSAQIPTPTWRDGCPRSSSWVASQCKIRAIHEELDQLNAADSCQIDHIRSSLTSEQLVERERRVLSAIATLNSQSPVIRIGMDTTGGYGHQSASSDVLRSLLRLGYKGKIQIVTTGFDTNRVHDLFSDLQTEPQISLINIEEARKHQVSLAFMGGNDGNGVVDGLNSKINFSFQPFQWSMYPRMICLDKPCAHGFQTSETRRGKVWCESANHPCFAPKSLQGEQQSIHYDLKPHDISYLTNTVLEEGRMRENIISAVEAVDRQDLNLMVGYFHNAPNEYDLCEITNGLRYFQEHHDNRGIVILSFATKDLLCTVSKQDHIYSHQLNDPHVHLPSKNEILILHSPRVPQILFRELVRRSNLPTVLEGANLTNLLRILQRPYISLWYGRTKLPTVKNCEHVKSAIEGVTHMLGVPTLDLDRHEGLDIGKPFAINNPGIQKVGNLIGKFLISTMTPSSAVSKYFTELGRMISLPENDMVKTGLIELEDFLKIPPEGLLE